MRRAIGKLVRPGSLGKACLASLVVHGCALGVMAAFSVHAVRQVAQMGSEEGVVVITARWAESEPTPALATIRLPREAMVIQPHQAVLERRLYLDVSGDQVPLKDLLADQAVENDQPTEPVEVEMELAQAEVDLPVSPEEATSDVKPVDRTKVTRPPQPKLAAKPVTSTAGVRRGPNFAGNRPPSYPAIARQNGWDGVVMLRILVGVDGRVRRVQIERSSGYEVLDAAAVSAVSTWHGSPAMLNGKPVETEELQPVRFQPPSASGQR